MSGEGFYRSGGPSRRALGEEYSEEDEEGEEEEVGQRQRTARGAGHRGGSQADRQDGGLRQQHGQSTAVGEPSLELLYRCGQSNHVRPRRGEAEEDFLSRVTHMTLTRKRLTCLSKYFKLCTEMRVMYAYDNRLMRIEHLESCNRLTHVYLQNNQLTDLSGLGVIKNLAKLYVDNNAIARVEGLEGLLHLQELHITDQRLPEGVALEFERNSMLALSRSLRVLSASRCGITDVSPLAMLGELRIANLGGNFLEHESVEGLEMMLAHMPQLRSLDLTDNPICHIPKYRDNIILMSQNLEELDGKVISGTERQFLLQLHIRKLKREQAAERREAKLMAAAAEMQQPKMQPPLEMYMHGMPTSQLSPLPRSELTPSHMAPAEAAQSGFQPRVHSGAATQQRMPSNPSSDAAGHDNADGLTLAGVNLS